MLVVDPLSNAFSGLGGHTGAADSKVYVCQTIACEHEGPPLQPKAYFTLTGLLDSQYQVGRRSVWAAGWRWLHENEFTVEH